MLKIRYTTFFGIGRTNLTEETILESLRSLDKLGVTGETTGVHSEEMKDVDSQ